MARYGRVDEAIADVVPVLGARRRARTRLVLGLVACLSAAGAWLACTGMAAPGIVRWSLLVATVLAGGYALKWLVLLRYLSSDEGESAVLLRSLEAFADHAGAQRTRDDSESYEVCLPDYESILPGLATIIGASYVPGDLDRFTDSIDYDHIDHRGRIAAVFVMRGTGDCYFEIDIEPDDGYWFGRLSGDGEVAARAREYLRDRYLEQGGAPDAQTRP